MILQFVYINPSQASVRIISMISVYFLDKTWKDVVFFWILEQGSC